MENKKHHLSGDPIGYLIDVAEPLVEKSIDEEPAVKNSIAKKIILGVAHMSRGIATLFELLSVKLCLLINIFSKIHFAAPYFMILLVIHYEIIPHGHIPLDIISAISGISVVIFCFLVWNFDIKGIEKQKWAVFWIVFAQTGLQVMTYKSGFNGWHLIGGACTLISYPFYILFSLQCEESDD